MAAGLDAMERLIAEADTKFEEKFRQVQRGSPTNLNTYSDRTYNLRQQVAHNTQLTSDEHFMELLQDTERLLATEYTVRGEVDRKLYALLAGLLKTLLRETVALPSFSARKIQLEMVWQWYHDKRGEVLEWAMQQQQQRGRGGGGASGGPSSEGAPLRSNNNVTKSGDTSFTGPENARSVDFSTDSVGARPSTSPAAIGGAPQSKFAAKFERVLASANSNDSAATGPNQPLLAKPVAPMGFTEEAERGREHAAIAKKLCLYKKRNLMKAEKLRLEALAKLNGSDGGAFASPNASQVTIVYTKDAMKRQQQKGLDPRKSTAATSYGPSGPPTFIHHASRAPEFDPSLGSVAATTTSALPGASAQQVQQQQQRANLDRAVANAQRHWVAHMARRVEDEHDAREFADSMAMFEFNQARIEEESARRQESGRYASQAGRTTHTILRRVPPATARADVKGGSAAETVQQPYVPVTVQSTLPSASLSDEEVATMLGLVSYGGSDVTLSPYDNYKPTPLDERKLKDLLSRVKTPDVAHTDARARLGLKSPHPRAMAATSSKNTALDVSVAPDARTTNTTVPSSGVPIIDLLFPALAVEDDVPSINRLQQMKLVERIRECFARTKTKDGRSFHVPRKVIESAILTPDDRPYEECIRLLPRPGSALPRDPNPRAAAGGKKKGGGKAKKK